MICNIEKKHNIMIKTEPLEPEDYFQPTGICADPGCRRLQQGIQVNHTPQQRGNEARPEAGH